MHGYKDRGDGIDGGDGGGGIAADLQVGREIDFLEGTVGADQLAGEGLGTVVLGEDREAVTGEPAVVVVVDGVAQGEERFGVGEVFVAPGVRELSGRFGVVGVGYQKPVGGSLLPDHGGLKA